MRRCTALFLIVWLATSCKEPVPNGNLLAYALSTSEIGYVTATSGLNYRTAPQGAVLGKFGYDTQLEIVEHTGIYESIVDDGARINAEWLGVAFKGKTVYVYGGFVSAYKNPTGIWARFPLKRMPLVDAINFSSFKEGYQLTSDDIKTMQLQELYPDIYTRHAPYAFYPSYSLHRGSYNSIVLAVVKGDHEMESVLIMYDDAYTLMKYYKNGDPTDKPSINSLVLSYDEIAEGWSQITATLKNNCITRIDALYADPAVLDTTLYHINNSGYINKVNTDFKNNIRPNQKIKLHKIYTDTIQFTTYNDDYDYFYLEGSKKDADVQLIYNWDVTPQKKFAANESIKITWKMDSIYIAGDGETLTFAPVAIDAVRLRK